MVAFVPTGWQLQGTVNGVMRGIEVGIDGVDVDRIIGSNRGYRIDAIHSPWLLSVFPSEGCRFATRARHQQIWELLRCVPEHYEAC